MGYLCLWVNDRRQRDVTTISQRRRLKREREREMTIRRGGKQRLAADHEDRERRTDERTIESPRGQSEKHERISRSIEDGPLLMPAQQCMALKHTSRRRYSKEREREREREREVDKEDGGEWAVTEVPLYLSRSAWWASLVESGGGEAREPAAPSRL